MENTRENVIKLLQAMADNRWSISQYAKERGDNDMADRDARECFIYEKVIEILVDDDYFNKLYQVYFKDGE